MVADGLHNRQTVRLHLPQQMPSLRVTVHNFLSIGIVCACLTHPLYNSYQKTDRAMCTWMFSIDFKIALLRLEAKPLISE